MGGEAETIGSSHAREVGNNPADQDLTSEHGFV